jgi:predicted transposase/invertase (TIGR01784 family)
MRPGIDPKVDYAFKRLFGSEGNVALLVHLLNAVLQPPPGEEVVHLKLLNPFNEKETLGDKLSVVDVKAHDQRDRQFTIEMQMLAQWFFPDRGLYYWAKLHQQQMQEADDYRALAPTISVFFLNGALFPSLPGHHHTFRLWDETHQATFSAQLAIHLLELPRFDLPAEQLASPLDVWCYFLRHGEQLDTGSLPPPLNIPPIHQALEVLNVFTQDDHERERYEARLKMRRDAYTALADALDQGIEKGIETGIEKGELIGRIRSCQRWLRLPVAPRDELRKLSLPELTSLTEQLEKQALPPAP